MKNERIHNIDTSGFNTPSDYFETLNDSILSKLKTNKLDSIKETGFKVPSNYFESIDHTILENKITKKESKVIQLFNKKNLIYISSIAAAILLLFNLLVFDNKPSFANLDIETVENYIIDDNISTYEIAMILAGDESTENIIINYDVNEDNIEEFLLNNTDIDDLMFE